MSANSDASSGPPLCHCGVPAVLRDSTNANFHGCVNQEKPSDSDFFDWAEPEMCPYGKRLVEGLKDKEEGMWAEIDRVEKLMEIELATYKANMEGQFAQFRARALELYQTREKLYKFREKMYKSREKMYQIALVIVILLMLFYVKK
ncbi:uncharacterized protein LOC133851927 [Alnus glutinosa]|uniref:uncharacterized protein LOC133851927 n=1 Tax=Alnus glutinosa TaxID=3517 RepID=UPI002D78CEA3|nr:uncharacterized protein LOC133851927 [Alnus glutinosa]